MAPLGSEKGIAACWLVGALTALSGRTYTELAVMIWGRLAQLVRALRRHRRGQWFESTIAHHLFHTTVATG
jgi:hypothetical protein